LSLWISSKYYLSFFICSSKLEKNNILNMLWLLFSQLLESLFSRLYCNLSFQGRGIPNQMLNEEFE
jgi:hypothetical protein